MTSLSNKYGHFHDAGRAFSITDPATPAPWVNVICNGRYGLVISQNGGGFSWFDDAQHNVLTRWEMDLVKDSSGKFLYLSDLTTGEVWSAAPAPCATKHDEYTCTHTQGSTTFATTANGIRTSWTLAVAPEDPVEVWQVELTNTTGRSRRLRISSYLDWCCGVAPDSKREFHRLFFTTTYDPARRAILATKNMWDIPPKSEREHWNQPWPYVAAHALCCEGFTLEHDLAIADKRVFLGRYGTPAAPKAMKDPRTHTSGFGRFGDAAAALGGDFTLAPGQTIRLAYLLAIAPTQDGVLALIDRYSLPGAAHNAATAARESWNQRLTATHIHTKREDFNLLNNHWLPYQSISGRLWGRSGYYQQSGARGFRDQLQDSQVWLPLDPTKTLDQIKLHATRQFKDGSVNHWWHALADFGNRTACSDDYLWLPFVTASYIRETGDLECLKITVPFMDEATGPSPQSAIRNPQSTILEHCKRSFDRAFGRTSPRGLPRIGSCDWNDGLSAMGIEEKGESVWLAMFLCHVLTDWTVIAERTGAKDLAADFQARRDNYAKAINAHAWDEAGWYRYGTKDNGDWVGASTSPEGKIHLNAQTWAMLSNIAPRDREQAAWNSVKKNLLSDYGPLLLAPAYTTPDPTIGYITRYAPGTRENGGVYMHAATWALAAACKLGDQEAVEQIWNSISPAHRGREADAYWAEPYVSPGNVDGPLSDLPGRAGWTWYTGSAAWLNRVCLEWILGIRPTWEGLLLDPCPPASLGKVKVQRLWRGVPITISFDAANYAQGRRATLTINGKTLVGNTIPSALVSDHGDNGRRGLEVEVDWPRATDFAAAMTPRPPAAQVGGEVGALRSEGP
jgi:cellobiose phosphorylase